MNKIKIGTTFSGIGAPEFAIKHIKDLEYANEWACDFDMKAKESYLANHKTNKFYDNIYYMTYPKNELLDMAIFTKKQKILIEQEDKKEFGLKSIASIDLYVFGFPCQNFSVGNSNRKQYSLDNIDINNTVQHQSELGMNATKTTLVYESLKIIKELSSRKNFLKYFIAENVKGLVTHDYPHIKQELKITEDEFNLLSESLKKKIKKIDGKYYKEEKGVILDDIKYIGYPSIFNPEYDGIKKGIGKTLYIIENSMRELNFEVTWDILNAKDFSFDYTDVDGGVQNRERIFMVGIDKRLNEKYSFPDKEIITKKDKPKNYLDNKNDTNKDLLIDMSRLDPINPNKGVCKKVYHMNDIKYESSGRVYDPTFLSPCLNCTTTAKFYTNGIARNITSKEMLSIQGFPIGTKNKGWDNNISEFKIVVPDNFVKKQAGNSMSVSTMYRLLNKLLKNKGLLSIF